MQTTEREEKHLQKAPAAPESQPLQQVSIVQVSENENDPEVIFAKAVAEIDTQPLPRRTKITIADVLQTIFCVSLIGGSIIGMIYQVITYTHTLVILYAREKPSSITASLIIPTRTLAPVTITRSQTTSTTGHGHQDARAASGILIFYNGNFSPQSIPVGTVFTGSDGEEVATNEAVTVPAAQPPQFAMTSASAYALSAGSKSNIAAGDINLALSSDLLVKNLASFNNGQDARDYKAVTLQDIQTLTSTINETLTQAFTTAFSIQQSEEAIPTQCHITTSANHRTGDEAQSVTITASKTCSAVAYKSQELNRQATAAFTQTNPASHYHLSGSIRTTVRSVSPFTVTLSGKWVYTFSQDYQQFLAEHIAGDSPAKAQAYLLRTGVISYASIPSTLPPEAMYIDFLVLVG